MTPTTPRLGWLRHTGTALCAALIAALLLAAAFPGLFGDTDPLRSSMPESLQAPSARHWFGTDLLGRDVFARVVHGARYSLLLGVAAMLISLVLGLLTGVVAGLSGRRADEAVARVLDVVSAFPGVLLAMLVVVFTGPGVFNIAVAIGISGVPKFARVIRAQTRSVKDAGYVTHARVQGRGRGWILARHIAPNVLVAVPVIATIDIGTSIVAVSGLSFLGLGPQPPVPEWGVMLSEGRDILRTAWWAGLFPGLSMTATVIAFTVVGRRLQLLLEGRTP
ncbi:ABC transporter permease [Streptomyces sp. NPDC001700]